MTPSKIRRSIKSLTWHLSAFLCKGKEVIVVYKDPQGHTMFFTAVDLLKAAVKNRIE